jgi:hypothetical protein
VGWLACRTRIRCLMKKPNVTDALLANHNYVKSWRFASGADALRLV